MKTILPFIRRHAPAVLLVALTLAQLSCRKEIVPETNIGAVVDLSVVSSLRNQLSRATSLDELPAEVKSAASAITTVLSTTEIGIYSKADLGAELTALKSAMTLTNNEITSLRTNDPNTYNAVVNRMSSIVSFASGGDLWKHHAVMVTNAVFDPFLASRAYSMETIYQNNDYQAIIDLRKVLDAYMVQMFQKVQDLKNNPVKSASISSDSPMVNREVQIATLVALILDQAHCILQPYRDKMGNDLKSAKGN